MTRSIAHLRREYARQELTEESAAPHPIDLFDKWFAEAVDARLTDANAMTLATADARGRISARILLLKGYDREGFTFFTNYRSRKARELDENPYAAMVFWWAELERQVTLNGPAARISEEDSEAYFRSRPRESQVGALASEQSEVIPGREFLAEQYREVEEKYAGKEVPRPSYWGGYILRPQEIEFWQGRPNRLHDRLLYRKAGDDTWTIERLAP